MVLIHDLARRLLATIVTPNTILRWHQGLAAAGADWTGPTPETRGSL